MAPWEPCSDPGACFRYDVWKPTKIEDHVSVCYGACLACFPRLRLFMSVTNPLLSYCIIIIPPVRSDAMMSMFSCMRSFCALLAGAVSKRAVVLYMGFAFCSYSLLAVSYENVHYGLVYSLIDIEYCTLDLEVHPPKQNTTENNKPDPRTCAQGTQYKHVGKSTLY